MPVCFYSCIYFLRVSVSVCVCAGSGGVLGRGEGLVSLAPVVGAVVYVCITALVFIRAIYAVVSDVRI